MPPTQPRRCHWLASRFLHSIHAPSTLPTMAEGLGRRLGTIPSQTRSRRTERARMHTREERTTKLESVYLLRGSARLEFPFCGGSFGRWRGRGWKREIEYQRLVPLGTGRRRRVCARASCTGNQKLSGATRKHLLP